MSQQNPETIMKSKFTQHLLPALALGVGLVTAGTAAAGIDGIEGPTFDLNAGEAYITTGDSNVVYMWGYGGDPRVMTWGNIQYPGPTLLVDQGDTVTINLSNNLPVTTSIHFPGQQMTAVPADLGDLTGEVAPGGTGTYSFVASEPGTFIYHSGTNAELQTEMGLFGALIVRPPQAKQAYNHPSSTFVYEYLSVISEIDDKIHQKIEANPNASIDFSTYKPVYWFVNGRVWPDSASPAFHPLWPYQPYQAVPRTHPGEPMLMRLVSGSRDAHPWHTHGNDVQIIARDGRLLESTPGAGADLAYFDYTVQVHPGATYDTIGRWSFDIDELNWDIYGAIPFRHADDGRVLPTTLPELQELGLGGFYSGSPFLGAQEALPPGEGGLNPTGAFMFMWHSHHEVEQVNNDIFPGGLTTILLVEHPDTPIE